MTHDEFIPSQVRIATDSDDGNGHRYETIQDAKNVFGVGNNKDAILKACDHAHQDARNKQEAMEYLSDHVAGKHVEQVAEILSTRHLSVEYDVDVDVGTDQNRGN
jgi:UDP-N-acetylglucosamine 2-epimerase